MENKLTDKQTMFCKEYLIDKNATQAAIRAGYSKKTSYSIGVENLKKPEIRKQLDRELNKQCKRLEVTADKVIQELAKIAFTNTQDLFDEDDNLKPLSELPPHISAAIASIEVNRVKTKGKSLNKEGEEEQVSEWVHKIRMWDKKGALELLAKHFEILGSKPEEGDVYHIYNDFRTRAKDLGADGIRSLMRHLRTGVSES